MSKQLWNVTGTSINASHMTFLSTSCFRTRVLSRQLGSNKDIQQAVRNSCWKNKCRIDDIDIVWTKIEKENFREESQVKHTYQKEKHIPASLLFYSPQNRIVSAQMGCRSRSLSILQLRHATFFRGGVDSKHLLQPLPPKSQHQMAFCFRVHPATFPTDELNRLHSSWQWFSLKNAASASSARKDVAHMFLWFACDSYNKMWYTTIHGFFYTANILQLMQAWNHTWLRMKVALAMMH